MTYFCRHLLLVCISLQFILSPFAVHAESPLRSEGYTEREIRLLFPDKFVEDDIKILNHEAETFKRKNSIQDLAKENPYKLDITVHKDNGDLYEVGRVVFVNYQGYIIEHYLPLNTDDLVIKMPKELLKDVPMTFLESHLDRVYSKDKQNRRVTIVWDDIITSQKLYKTTLNMTSADKDLLAKAVVIGLVNNKKLHKLNEESFDKFLSETYGKDLDAVAGTKTVDPTIIDKLLPLYNIVIEKFNVEIEELAFEKFKFNRENSPEVNEDAAMKEAWEVARSETLKALENKNFEVHNVDFGKAELTTIDKKVIARIRPHGAEDVYLWMPKGLVDSNSKHFRQYIARQHKEAGSDRTDGEKGRDVVIVWAQPLDSKESSSEQPLMNSKVKTAEDISSVAIEKLDRPEGRTFESFKSYWRAQYKPLNRADQKFAIVCAITQMVVMGSVSGLSFYLDPNTAFDAKKFVLSVSVTGFFGAFIGLFSSTYQNVVYRTGTRADSEFKVRTLQTAKSAVVSVLFVMSMGMVTSSLNSMSDYMKKAGNIIANSYGKTEVNQWAVLLREKRADTETFKIRLRRGAKPFDTGLNQGKVNFQLISQNMVLFLRSMDLLGVTAFGLPIGSIVFYSSIPIVKRLTLFWAERYHKDDAKKLNLRKNWDNYILNPRPSTFKRNLYNATIKKMTDIYKERGAKENFTALVNDWSYEDFEKNTLVMPNTSRGSMCSRLFTAAML